MQIIIPNIRSRIRISLPFGTIFVRLVGIITFIFSGVVLMVATETHFVFSGLVLVLSASALGGL